MKDRKARTENSITVVALANLIAALVDTMRMADVPNDVVHNFLDELDRMNELTTAGHTLDFMLFLTSVMRKSLASND